MNGLGWAYICAFFIIPGVLLTVMILRGLFP